MYDQAVIRSQAAGGAYTVATLPTATQMLTQPVGSLAHTTDAGLYLWNGSVWQAISNQIPGQTLYVEAMVGNGRAGYGTPGGLTNYADIYQSGAYELTGVTVTGVVGATTLTINTGTVADLSGTWAGCIEHTDGIWRTYTIKSASGTTLNVYPPLEVPASNARLVNVHDVASGQHYSEKGYYALADYIFNFNPVYGIRDNYFSRFQDTDISGWSLYGGLSAGRVTYNTAVNVDAGYTNATQKNARTIKALLVACNTNAGVSKTFTTTGLTGFFETYISCNDASVPARVDVYLDSNLVFREDIYGIRQIRIPFGSCSSLQVIVYSLALQTGATYIGSTTIWKTPAAIPPHLFNDGDRVVWLGDSWTYRAGGALMRRLQYNGASKGLTFIPVGSAGQQATWGISNFSSVSALNPTAVIIEFFVNDYNSLGVAGLATWQANIATLVSLVKTIGARPIVLMPCETASQSQSQGLAQWSAGMAEGTQVSS